MQAVLKRAQNVTLHYQQGFFNMRGWLTLTIGKTSHRLYKLRAEDYSELREQANAKPILLLPLHDRHYWWFQSRFYIDIDSLNEAEVTALLITRHQRERQHIANAQATVTLSGPSQHSRRTTIPEDVKQLVMIRDGGKCTHCGSTVELQFDHIIPIARGGSSNPENLQILCGPCNRRKGTGVAINPNSVNPQASGSPSTQPAPPQDHTAPWWTQPGI